MAAVAETISEGSVELSGNGLTLLELVMSLSRRTKTGEQTAQIVLDLVAAERVQLVGNFQNSHLVAG